MKIKLLAMSHFASIVQLSELYSKKEKCYTLFSCSCEAGSQDTQEQKQMQLRESSLTPWEMWFVGKEKEERGRLQQKVLEVKLVVES